MELVRFERCDNSVVDFTQNEQNMLSGKILIIRYY